MIPDDIRSSKEGAWLELALEVGRMGIWSWDIATNQLHWSSTLSRVYGLPEGEAPSSFEAYLAYVHPDDRAAFEGNARAALSGGGEFSSEHRCLTANGKVSWVRAKAKVFRDDRGAPISMMGTCIDVSEQKLAESKLLFAERMISIGKLAAGVTHELNAPLGYISSNTLLMRMQLDHCMRGESFDLDLMNHALAAISEGTERMRAIMSDLGAFSSEGREPVAVDLKRLLQASVRLVSNEIRDRASITFDFAERLPPTSANESKLGQVFINLLLNAAHAIAEAGRERGEIHVRTHVDEKARVVVSISDNGVGIAPETLVRIFEPFFTTRESGKGTGLGLAVCESIVTGLGGHLVVESELGRGSSFRVVLPTAPISAPEIKKGESAAMKGGGRVLVVDDAASFRYSLQRLLEAHGFDVIVADSGATALPQALLNPNPDVILCDLMMPGMDGMDFHEALGKTRPELARRIVFLTGGAFTPQAGEFLDRVDNPRLEKPFDLPHLIAAIERAKSL